MKKNFLLSLFLISLASGAIAQEQSKPRKQPHSLSIHLRIPTPTDSVRTTLFEVGIYDYSKRLTGIGLNLAAGVYNNMSGLLVSGLGNITGVTKGTVQIAGITNINGASEWTLAVSGLMNISASAKNSILLSGLANITSTTQDYSISAAGLLNVSGGTSRAIHLAGLANITGANAGFQLAPFNISGENRGVELGIANVNGKGKHGLQLGVVNISGDKQQTQLGLVNISPETQYECILQGGNNALAGVEFRFRKPYTYTQSGISFFHPDFGHRMDVGFTYRLGTNLPLTDKISFRADAGYTHLIRLSSSSDLPHTLFGLQPRVGIAYPVTSRIALELMGGYEWIHSYSGNYKTHRLTGQLGLSFRL